VTSTGTYGMVLRSAGRAAGAVHVGALPASSSCHMARTLVEIVPIGRPGTETFS
jgi:hypothetical protein